MHTKRYLGRLAQGLLSIPHLPGGLRLAKTVLALLPDGVILAGDKWGICYFVHHASHVGNALLTRKESEASILHLAKQELKSTSNPTILDVGANAGTFSLPLSEIADEIYLIEADPELASLLRKSVQYNDLRNTTIIHAAISQTDAGTVSFHRAKNLKDLSSLKKSYVDGRDQYEAIDVPAERLDALLESEDIEKVDLLKIDIEGMTSEAIYSIGDRAEDVQTIIAEPDEDIERASHFLKERGFSASRPLADRHDLSPHTRDTVVFRR